jgi:alkanesulfonate monooxygenase SsuD/methylene tetrahydromethanopterin reductase-like flavin-dependent oxidoreductase (luciferase family)
LLGLLLAAAAHEASERPTTALQTNLIAADSFAEAAREWYHYAPAATPQQPGQAQQAQRVGPVSKAEIRQLHRSDCTLSPCVLL